MTSTPYADCDPAFLVLELAVPLRIAELARMTAERRDRTIRDWAADAATMVAHRGDQLMFRSKPHKGEGGTAAVFNALAKGLAAGSFLPGGITYLGRHWQADPPARSATAPVPRQRAVITVQLPDPTPAASSRLPERSDTP